MPADLGKVPNQERNLARQYHYCVVRSSRKTGQSRAGLNEEVADKPHQIRSISIGVVPFPGRPAAAVSRLRLTAKKLPTRREERALSTSPPWPRAEPQTVQRSRGWRRNQSKGRHCMQWDRRRQANERF